MEKETKVLIWIPNGSWYFPAAMVRSLLELRKPVPCQIMVIERQMIELSRNGLAIEAIRSWATHLLMIDDDNPVPADTLEILLQSGKDIVIAPILWRNKNQYWVHPLCAFYAREIEVDNKLVKLYDHIVDFREAWPLHKIDGWGTGCMLIKVEVLKRLFLTYKDRIFERTHIKFGKEVEIDGKKFDSRSMSEDVEFCERAIDAWFELRLDDRVRPLHITAPKFIQYVD